MRKGYCIFLALAMLIFLSTISNAQYDYVGINPSHLEFNEIGGGARAAGMGGAFLGIAGGEMAYSWNPAAMIYTDKTKIGVQLASVADKFSSVSTYYQPFLYPEPNIQSLENKREHFSMNFGGFSAPFEFMEKEWAVGGGYRNVYDMIGEYSTPGFAGSENTFKQDRGIDAVSVGIAHKIMEGVGVGLTANAYVRNSEYNLYVGASNMRISMGQDTSIVDTWVNSNSHFSGFNLDLGVSADFGMIKGGAVIHTPYDLRQESKQTINIIIPPAPIGIVDRVTYTYSMPLGFSLGIGIVPVENFTLAFDFDSRPLSKVEVHTDWEQTLSEQFTFADSTFNPEWEDVNQFRIGAEYILDAGFADIPVRAGFRNEPSAIKERTSLAFDETDSTWAREYGDQISTNIITFGTGLSFEKIWFDLAYQFGSSSYNSTVDFTEPQPFEIKRDYSRLFISVGMYF